MFQGFATRNYKATRHDYQDVHYKSATKHICIFVAAAAVEQGLFCARHSLQSFNKETGTGITFS